MILVIHIKRKGLAEHILLKHQILLILIIILHAYEITDNLGSIEILNEMKINVTGFQLFTFCMSFFQTQLNSREILFTSIEKPLSFFLKTSKTEEGFHDNITFAFKMFRNFSYPKWERFCVEVNKADSTLNAWIDETTVLKNVAYNWDSENFQIKMIESKATRLSLIEVYPDRFGKEGTGCGQAGSVYTWNAADWSMEGASVNVGSINMEEICSGQRIFLYPMKVMIIEAPRLCSLLKG